MLTVLSLCAAAAGGFAAGRLVQSPDEEAASRMPPPPSVITAAVQPGPLASELVGRGMVRNSVTAEIVLGGPVSGDVTRQVVTSARSLGEDIPEGSVVLEVSGRPVFAFAGPAPVYRSLNPGASGRDVEQLQQALRRLGYSGVRVTRVFDDATRVAVAALYKAAGYPASLQAEDLVTFPAGEMTFVQQLPMKVMTVEKVVGAVAEGVLARLAGGALQVEGTLNRADAALVRVGMMAKLATDDRTLMFDGEVSVVSALPAVPGAGGAAPGGEFRIVVKPTHEVPASLQASTPLRISLPIGASDEDSLVVPVAAVVTRADGLSTVTVARGAGTEAVSVSVGLAANGLVTVKPIDGGHLAIEDRVVVSHVPS